MTGQPLRPSQFILTFGVGSIIDAPNGPRIIGDFERWGKPFTRGSNPPIQDFQITSSEASALLDNGFIFRIPTNLDLNKKDSEIIFRTTAFPQWTLCQKHNCLAKIINGISQCSDCRREGNNSNPQKEAIRFVRACRNGHLDDVEWNAEVHGHDKSCVSNEFIWGNSGSSLRSVFITCKKCGKSTRLSNIFYSKSKCSGRYPESEFRGDCKENSRVVLRGSSSLRIPELITSVTIPPRETKLHRIFERIQIRAIMSVQSGWTKKELLEKFRESSRREPGLIDNRVIQEIEESSDEQISEAIEDIRSIRKISSMQDVKNEELKALLHSAKYGHPPNPEQFKSGLEFQVNVQDIMPDVRWNSLSLRVTPIERLRVVIVQKGYRRLGTDINHKMVPTFYLEGDNKWYPGIELIGEGIFIDKPKGFNIDGEHAESWNRIFNATNDLKDSPISVWWHTLSHRIISALSLDSGYSSTAIRERIYTPIEGKETNSGILLYTVQTGGDGTLGGLTDQVPRFDQILEAALKNINFCSNDPLCSEEKADTNRHNGAACYACQFLSETSCECSNKYLDRNLLKGNLK